jgi:hypothetical protein
MRRTTSDAVYLLPESPVNLTLPLVAASIPHSNNAAFPEPSIKLWLRADHQHYCNIPSRSRSQSPPLMYAQGHQFLKLDPGLQSVFSTPNFHPMISVRFLPIRESGTFLSLSVSLPLNKKIGSSSSIISDMILNS